MQWIELSAGCAEDQVSGISAILEKYGQGGVAVEEWEENAGGGQTGRKTFLVKAYLPYNRAYRGLKEGLQSRLNEAGYGPCLHEKSLKQDEWFDSLRKNFKVMEIGEHFVVKPSWTTESLNYPGRVIIEMDPGAAFGTGLHPTTRLCLLNLHRYLKPGMSVYDLGTGTGILAIAAAKLGAASVMACDIDMVAVKAAAANAIVNQVNDRIQFKRGTLSRAAQLRYRAHFDIVLANITARAISDLSQGLADILKPAGVLIVSGIHPDGLDEVLIRLSLAGLSLINLEREQEWSAVIARKPEQPESGNSPAWKKKD